MCVERRSIPLWEEGDGLLVAAATPQARPAGDPEFSAAAVVGRCHNPVVERGVCGQGRIGSAGKDICGLPFFSAPGRPAHRVSLGGDLPLTRLLC